jgi:hypothetical protein
MKDMLNELSIWSYRLAGRRFNTFTSTAFFFHILTEIIPKTNHIKIGKHKKLIKTPNALSFIHLLSIHPPPNNSL